MRMKISVQMTPTSCYTSMETMTSLFCCSINYSTLHTLRFEHFTFCSSLKVGLDIITTLMSNSSSLFSITIQYIISEIMFSKREMKTKKHEI